MRPLLVLGILVLFSLSGFAWQAADAENAVVQGHYLNDGERAAVFKALPQVNGAPKYWLVSVYENDVLRTILPISDKDGSLVPRGALRTNLISAQLWVQRLTVLKSSSPWLISLPTSNKLAELATAIDNEQFDVDIVAQSVSNSAVKTEVSALKGKLDTLSTDLRLVSDAIQSLNGEETSLLNVTIDTEPANGLGDAYASVYDSLSQVANEASAYDSLVAQAKNHIANLSDVDATQKTQWISLLSPLGPSQSLTNAVSGYSDVSVQNQQQVSVELAGLPTKVAALEAEADARMLRSRVYDALYGDDPTFKKVTAFSSLKDAATTILAEENSSRWKDQADVTKLSSLWSSAEKSFSRAQYQSALDSAQNAKALAKKIKDAGISSIQDPAQQLSANLVSGFALVLGGVALILIGKTVWKYAKPRSPASEE